MSPNRGGTALANAFAASGREPGDLANRIYVHVTAIRADRTSLVVLAHDGNDSAIGKPRFDGHRTELLARTILGRQDTQVYATAQ